MRYLLWLLLLGIANTHSFAQIPAFLPDSVKKSLAHIPESLHDSVYLDIGNAYYSTFTDVGYSRALTCFNEAIRLSEKYQHHAKNIDALYGIGTVYDALGDDYAKALFYYQKAFDLHVRSTKNVPYLWAFNLSYTYNKLGDSLNSTRYIQVVQDSFRKYYPSDMYGWHLGQILTAYIHLQNHNIKGFMREFAKVDTTKAYKDRRFPYGRYFAVCRWRYAYEKGDYRQAIESMTFELANNTTDSAYLLPFLTDAYAKNGDYKAAYYWASQLTDVNKRHLKADAQKDLTVNLLKTDSYIREKERQLLATERRYLWGSLFLLALGASIAAYFWYDNRRDKMELAKRNTEKELLLNEVHHRVKNNLQLLYSLAQLQLPSIEDENSRILWQKNLSQLKTMTLVNEKLRYTEGGNSVVLTEYVHDLTTYFSRLFSTPDKPFIINCPLPTDWIVDADFAIPFGLILSELLVNSYKYKDKSSKNGENNAIDIQIENVTNTHFTCRYTDFGKATDPSVLVTKQVGGIALIRDLTEQLKGNLSITHEPFLSFIFNFPK